MIRAAIRRAAVGCLLGILGGGLALMIAFGRASLVERGGPTPWTLTGDGQALLATALLAAFALCGALVGVLAPLRRTVPGAIGLSLIAATGFLTTVFVGLAGPPTSWSPSTWWSLGVGAILLGAVVAGHVQPSAEPS